jgi:hypothetical protein
VNITQHNIPTVRIDEFLRRHVARLCDRTPQQPDRLHEDIYALLEIAFVMGRISGVDELAKSFSAKVAA